MDQEHDKKPTEENAGSSNTSNVTAISDLKTILQQMVFCVDDTFEGKSHNRENAKQAESKDRVSSTSESKKLDIIMEDDDWEEWNDAEHLFDEMNIIELDKAVVPFNETDKKELDKTDGQVVNDKLLPEAKACNNSILLENSTEMYKRDDVKKLLDTVDQWDIYIKNYITRLENFNCLECNFKTTKFKDWKYHITSISHMTSCCKIANFYSYICFNENCKILLYGANKSLKNHMKEHKENFKPSGISTLMKEVMKCYVDNNRKPLYFCSHCAKFSDTPIHPKDSVFRYGARFTIDFYCKTCKVTFISTPETIDYHSLSVEHMTIKCFDKFGITVKTIPKEQSNQNEDAKEQPNVQSELPINTVQFPRVVLNRFEDINGVMGECKFCDEVVHWNDRSLLHHLIKCEWVCDLTGSNKTNVRIFMCTICNHITNDMDDHKLHITSYLHLINCHNTDNYYSYVCDVCNMYMYSHKVDILNHWKLDHNNVNITQRMPLLFTFMAKLFRDINKNPNTVEMVHYYGENEACGSSIVINRCNTCKIGFYHVNDYNMHEITSEHIILKYVIPNISVTYTNTSQTNYKELTETPVVQNSPLLEDNDYPIFGDDESELNITMNEISACQTDEDDTAFLYQHEYQEIFGNTMTAKRNYNDDLQLFGTRIDVRSKPSHSRQNYKNYFVKIMDIKDVLKKKLKPSSMQYISYYCNVCDKIEGNERLWVVHYQTFHANDKIMPTIYCSSCNLYIYGCTAEDHSNTTEHCDYLQLMDILSPEKDMTEPVKSGPSSSHVKTDNLNNT